ncbi:MAG: fibronectin type III domain-containing protein [Gammaproteobacteria bacterium]
MTAFLAAFLAASPALAQSGIFPHKEASLHSFGAPGGVLSPPFSPRTVRYDLWLPDAPLSVSFAPRPGVAGTEVAVNGVAVTNAAPRAVVQLTGTIVTTATFAVTALDRVTTREYQLRIFRAVAPAKPVVTLTATRFRNVLVVWENNHAAHLRLSHHNIRVRVKSPQGNWQDFAGNDDPDGHHEGFSRSGNDVVFSPAVDAEYEFQVRATNAIGSSDWSDLQSVTTAAEGPRLQPPPFPPALFARDRSLIAIWRRHVNPRTAIGYFLRWRETAGEAEWQSAGGDDDNGQFIAGLGNNRYVITGLRNETEYTLQIAVAGTAATADNIDGFFGPGVRATPSDIVSPPQAPRPNAGEDGVYASCAEKGVCWLSWDPPLDDGNSEITGYRIRWRIAAGDAPTPTPAGAWNEEKGVASNGNTLGHVITFTQAATFEAQVAAVNAAGRSPWSNSNEFRSTLATSVSSSNTSNFTAITLTEAGSGNPIALTPPFSGTVRVYQATVGMAVTAVTLDANRDSQALVYWRGSQIVRLSSIPATIRIGRGLNPIRIQGRKLGSQDLSVYHLTIMRPGGLPGQPSPPDVSAASETALTVSWRSPSPGSAPLSGYRIRWRTSAAPNRAAGGWRDASGGANTDGHEITNAGVTEYTITGLQEGGSYDAQVRAHSALGSGEWSASGTAAAGSPNTSLTSLTFRASETLLLTPAFDLATFEYQAYFTRAERAVSVRAQSAHAAAVVRVDGRELSRADTAEVPLLQNASKRITVVVNAPNRATSRVYVFNAHHLPPPPQPQFSATRTNSAPSITAKWLPAITAYANSAIVHLKTASTAEWPSQARANSLPGGVTARITRQNGAFTATLAGVAAETIYDVRIAGAYVDGAINAVGPFSETMQVTSGAVMARPGAPRNLRIIPGDAQLSLRWSPPADTGTAGALTYRVRLSKGYATSNWNASNGVIIAHNSAAATLFPFTLERNQIYALQVAAENSVGRGDFSETAHGLTGAFDLEVSFNGGAPDWVDGVLIARYLLGLRGDALLRPALTGVTAEAAQIAAKIDAGIIGVAGASLDVDNNGAVTAADGIMVARYLLGVRGAALIDGQADSSASAATAVEGRISALMP